MTFSFIETSYVQSVGAAQLGKILGLESECLSCFGPSQSIVFVIDTTGSMADDIRAVRLAALELVTKTIIAPSYHPYNYILVTFNDPGMYNYTLLIWFSSIFFYRSERFVYWCHPVWLFVPPYIRILVRPSVLSIFRSFFFQQIHTRASRN